MMRAIRIRKANFADFARAIGAPQPPAIGARSQNLALMMADDHRTSREHQRWQVHARGRHDLRRKRLVAPPDHDHGDRGQQIFVADVDVGAAEIAGEHGAVEAAQSAGERIGQKARFPDIQPGQTRRPDVLPDRGTSLPGSTSDRDTPPWRTKAAAATQRPRSPWSSACRRARTTRRYWPHSPERNCLRP